ncbi:MAG: MTH1187 family thiamine-binding protein [Nitrososphaeraceae archaeon]
MTSNIQPLVHAEISVIPILGSGSAAVDSDPESDTGMSKQIAIAFNAIRGLKDVNAVLTPMGTQIESGSFENILKAIEAAHQSLRTTSGIKRIVSTIRIDERLDKSATLEDKVKSVKEKL